MQRQEGMIVNWSEPTSSSANIDDDFQFVVDSLANLEDRPTVLRALALSPLGDVRIIPYLKSYLSDRTICVVSIPYKYGETRLLAAGALHAEYEVLKIEDSIVLTDVVQPLDESQISRLARDAELLGGGDILETIEELRVLQRLPLRDVTFER